MHQLTTVLRMYVNSILVQSLPTNKVIQILLSDTEIEDMGFFSVLRELFLSLSQIQKEKYNRVCVFAKLHVFANSLMRTVFM